MGIFSKFILKDNLADLIFLLIFSEFFYKIHHQLAISISSLLPIAFILLINEYIMNYNRVCLLNPLPSVITFIVKCFIDTLPDSLS